MLITLTLILGIILFKPCGGILRLGKQKPFMFILPQLFREFLAPLALTTLWLGRSYNYFFRLKDEEAILGPNIVPTNIFATEGETMNVSVPNVKSLRLVSEKELEKLRQDIRSGNLSEAKRIHPATLFQLFDYLDPVNFPQNEEIIFKGARVNDASFIYTMLGSLPFKWGKVLLANGTMIPSCARPGNSGVVVDIPQNGAAALIEERFRGRTVQTMAYLGSSIADHFVKVGEKDGKLIYLGQMGAGDHHFGFFLLYQM